MKRIIFGVLLAFVFALVTVALAERNIKQEATRMVQDGSSVAHDVGLPEPLRVPPPPTAH